MLSRLKWISFLTSAVILGFSGFGQEGKDLDTVEVIGWRVAIEDGQGTFSAPVSSLRYEPEVDVQGRNMAEIQGDVAIRGGIFENTGFRLGAVTLMDPQTGHYFAEIPVATRMLNGVDVYTGLENSLFGFNSTVGTVQYGFRPIQTGGEVALAFGNNGMNLQQIYGAYTGKNDQTIWGVDAELARSESNGTRDFGDHEFKRGTVRLQAVGESRQTDILVGHQEKYFQWPYLYALQPLHDLVGSPGIESEDLRTTLVQINHVQQLANGTFTASAFYRRNEDDYEFDITRPGLFNPFEHTTEVWGAGIDGSLEVDSIRWDYSAQMSVDAIDSTSLTFAGFDSRTYARLAVVPRLAVDTGSLGPIQVRVGGVLDWTDRDGSAFSGIAQVDGQFELQGDPLNWRIGYAGSTQVPGYTAIGSNPNGGLFRGNPLLDRERSHNVEVGMEWLRGAAYYRGLVFYRIDQDLVDWVFDSGVTPFASRFAENVNIDTAGVELQGGWKLDAVELQLAYAYLAKSADYGRAGVDASFYALNFPEHRAVFSLVSTLWDRYEVRADNEWRIQEANTLRNGSDSAFFTQLSLVVRINPRGTSSVVAGVDNLWDVDFEEVPGVPGRGRQYSLAVRITM